VGSEYSCTVFKVTSVLFISDIDDFRKWNWVIFWWILWEVCQ